MLDDVERLMGYGSANFTKRLVETYRRLGENTFRMRMFSKFARSTR